MALVKPMTELRNFIWEVTWRLEHCRFIPRVGMLCQLLEHVVCPKLGDLEFAADIAKITVLLENVSQLVGNQQFVLDGVSK